MALPRTFTSSPLPPRERGVEFGRAHRADVRRTAAAYRALFARRGGPGFDTSRWVPAFRETIGDLDPDALAEITGIAEGAALDPLEVVAINARTELLAKADPFGEREYQLSPSPVSECSAVLVVPPDAAAYGAQTWDWYAAMDRNWLHWRIPMPDGTWLETVTEYGLLAKIGVSSRRVGVLLTLLHHAGDANQDAGFPVHLVSRRILSQATSYDDAQAICEAICVSASTSLTVLDPVAGGTIELFPGTVSDTGPGHIGPTDGLLVRTNHFVTAAGQPGCLSRDTYPSTRIRADVLEERLRPTPPTGPDAVLAAMRHHHLEGGVCRHGEEDLAPALRTATLATVVIEPSVPSMRVFSGGPCAVTG